MIIEIDDRQFYDDFELCSQTNKQILKMHKGSIVLSDLINVERIVVLVWAVTGYIGNGGFHYLFESELPGDPDYSLTIDAFRSIGCHEALDSINKALCLFHECRPPKDDKLRIGQYEDWPPDMLDDIDSAFLRSIEGIREKLAEFIRKEFFPWRLDSKEEAGDG